MADEVRSQGLTETDILPPDEPVDRTVYIKYESSDGQWRWRLLASNYRVIANGGESFHNEADVDASIALVMSTDGDTPVRVERRSRA